MHLHIPWGQIWVTLAHLMHNIFYLTVCLCVYQIGRGSFASLKDNSAGCILVVLNRKPSRYLTGTYRMQLVVTQHRFLPWEKRNKRHSSPFPTSSLPSAHAKVLPKSTGPEWLCLQCSTWFYGSKGGSHRWLLCGSKEADHIWSVYSGPVTRTLAVAALWSWCREFPPPKKKEWI